MDDIEAIRQLKARYFRTMDTKDWDAMRQVFTDDVVIDTSEAGGNVAHGADEFMAFLQEALASAVTVHHGHMPEIDADLGHHGHRDLGAARHVIWPTGAARGLRPLPRDLREGRRRRGGSRRRSSPACTPTS